MHYTHFNMFLHPPHSTFQTHSYVESFRVQVIHFFTLNLSIISVFKSRVDIVNFHELYQLLDKSHNRITSSIPIAY